MGLSKHGPLYRKLIWISLAVLLCGYVLCAALLGGGAPETVAASVCKVGDGCTVSGFVVFFEKTVATARASAPDSVSRGDAPTGRRGRKSARFWRALRP